MNPLTTAWGLAGSALAPLAPRHLQRRAARGKEDPVRLDEKRGFPGRDRPDGPLVWLHAASVGETMAVLPLLARLSGGDATVLLTTGTTTSARLAADRAPAGVIHQFAPLDAPAFAERFLDHWRPAAALFAESEIWPTLIARVHRRRIPFAIVNARMSASSFRTWRRLGPLTRPVFAALTAVAAQSEANAARFRQLGAPVVATSGNLKGDAPALPVEEAARAALAARIADRPLLLAASTHPGEDAIVCAAHASLADRWPRLLTIIVPRHPDRGSAVAELAREAGLAVAPLRSAGALPEAGDAIYVADTLGELGLFYRLAPIVVLGGSLAPVGGHNPFEPAQLGCAIVTGPATANFSDAFEALASAGAARVTRADAASVTAAVTALLSDPAEVAAMAEAALGVAAASRGALERTLQLIAPLLPAEAVEAARR